jgi:hypothetical protein
MNNSGSSTSRSNCSAGNTVINNVSGPIFFSTTLTGNVTGFYCFLYSFSNTTQFTMTGTSVASFTHSQLGGGSNAAMTVGSGCTAVLFNCIINSTNANVVSGAGTIDVSGTSYSATGQSMSVTTIVDYPFGRKGTWTPVVTFGGGNTGLTYTHRNLLDNWKRRIFQNQFYYQ